MKTVYKTSKSPKRSGLHTRKTNIQENSLITKQAFHQKAFSMKTFYKTSLHPKKQENSLQKTAFHQNSLQSCLQESGCQASHQNIKLSTDGLLENGSLVSQGKYQNYPLKCHCVTLLIRILKNGDAQGS